MGCLTGASNICSRPALLPVFQGGIVDDLRGAERSSSLSHPSFSSGCFRTNAGGAPSLFGVRRTDLVVAGKDTVGSLDL